MVREVLPPAIVAFVALMSAAWANERSAELVSFFKIFARRGRLTLRRSMPRQRP